MISSASSLVVIGSSAGGLAALSKVVEGLPASLPAAVLVVQHLPPTADAGIFAAKLGRHTALACQVSEGNEPLRDGTLYLAPADHHLLVKDSSTLLVRGARENRHRPAVDALFRSAAVSYGHRVTGVVLSGMLHDGVAGLEAIKRCGGNTIAQDPDEAEFPGMPQAAITHTGVDYVKPLAEMPALLLSLAEKAAGDNASPIQIPDDLRTEARIAERVLGSLEDWAGLGELTPLTCGDCGGVLRQMAGGTTLRYRCHTGHAFLASALEDESRKDLEETLWVALRMMEEYRMQLVNMSRHSKITLSGGDERIADLGLHISRLREMILAATSRATEEASHRSGQLSFAGPS